MTSINPSLPALAGLHLQNTEDTAPPAAVQNQPPLPPPPADRISSHIMMGKEKISVGSTKPLDPKEKALLTALLKTVSGSKTVIEVQGHDYEVNVKAANKQLSHLTATCTSDPTQNDKQGYALNLAFEPLPFPILKLPRELQNAVIEQAAITQDGNTLNMRQASKHSKELVDSAYLSSLHAFGYDRAELNLMSSLPIGQKNFIVENAKVLFDMGYDKHSLSTLSASPADQRNFVLNNRRILARLDYNSGDRINEVAAMPERMREGLLMQAYTHALADQQFQTNQSEMLARILRNRDEMSDRVAEANSRPAPNIEF